MMRVLLITGGSLEAGFLKETARAGAFDRVLCADSGLEAADQAEIPIDYLTGDFDSVNGRLLERYEGRSGVQITRYPPEKDETDTEIAMKLALSLGAEEITVVGGIGSRLDHTLANLHLLKMALDKGVSACLLDRHNRIRLIRDTLCIEKGGQYGDYLSLLPLTETVGGVSLYGMKYPLSDRTLRIGESIGISNEIVREKAEIRLKSGILIVMETSDEGRKPEKIPIKQKGI